MPHPDMSASWVNGHPGEGLLHEWLDEQLSATDASMMQAHVDGCAKCAALVAEARGLIAASHRILSALDEVPANVIPVQGAVAAADKTVVNFASARMAHDAELASRARKQSAPSRWRTVGKVAALLLIALIPGVVLFRGVVPFGGDDVAVPLGLPKAEIAADSAAGGPVAPALAAPLADARTASAALGNAVRSESERAPAVTANELRTQADRRTASDAPARQQPALASAERSVATSAPASPPAPAPKSASALTAANTIATTTASALASGRTDSAQVQALDRTASARSSSAASGTVGSPPSATPPVAVADQVTLLQGRVAAAKSGADDGRAGGGGGRAGGGRGGLAAGRAEVTLPATPIPQLTNAPAQRALAGAPPPAGGAAFDSVTLTRTLCGVACETTVLHVNSLGGVRYSVSSGSTTKPAVTAQLSSSDRERIERLLAQSITESATFSGQLRCAVTRAAGSTALELVLARGTAVASAEVRCSTPDTTLLRLGAAIDSVAGTDALRRRVP